MNPGFPDILAMPPDMRYNISKRMMRLLTEHTKSPGGHDSGAFLFRFGAGGLGLRLATSYILPSSHLQMQYAATLARTEIKNDEITLTKYTPFFYLYRGGSLYSITWMSDCSKESRILHFSE